MALSVGADGRSSRAAGSPQGARGDRCPQPGPGEGTTSRTRGQPPEMSTPLPDHPFTTTQARAWGWSPTQLRSAIKARRVVRLLHGVYLRGDVVPSTRIKLRAAALVISPHAVVCDRTAAWIWGVPCHDHRELDSVPPVETYVLRGHAPTDRPEVAGGTRDLMPCDWVEVEGVRVTTPLRTAMDLGCSMVRRRALAVMDGLMRGHAFTVATCGGCCRDTSAAAAWSSSASSCRSSTGGQSHRASRGPGWRSSTTDCRRPSRSGGSTSTGSRRTVSTWPTRTRASPWSTTAPSSTRVLRTERGTWRGGPGSASTGGR